MARPNEAVEVKLNVSFEIRDGALRVVEGRPSSLIGIPYDRPVVGYGGKTINTLAPVGRQARPTTSTSRNSAAAISSARWPKRSPPKPSRACCIPTITRRKAKVCDFLQEYFLVACSLADLVRRFRAAGNDWSALPDKVAIQLNDTHPTLAVPELMRLLLDEAKLSWDDAWNLTQRTLAYTNHTLLPEALEKWPVQWFEDLLPRHLEIIYEINRRFLDDVRARYPGDEGRVSRVSLIEEGAPRQVRMAHLAIVGSHSTNGVAALHSELLKQRVVPDFAAMFPERFNNKTNGVTPRRWLLLANPALAAVITEAIGDGWITDLAQLEKLKPLADDKSVLRRRPQSETRGEDAVSQWLNATAEIDPDRFSTRRSSASTNTNGNS